MRIVAQVIANSVLQRVPSIVIKINDTHYVFNVPEHHTRYIRKHCYTHNQIVNIFYTAYTMPGTLSFLLDLFIQKKMNSTKIMVNESGFKYLEELKYFLAQRMLPLSYCFIHPTQHKPNLFKYGLAAYNGLSKIINAQSFSEISFNVSTRVLGNQ